MRSEGGVDMDETHTTRCRFERRMPPLNTAMASPRLQIACPGRGYCDDSTSSVLSTMYVGVAHAHLDVLPSLPVSRSPLERPCDRRSTYSIEQRPYL